MGVRKNFEISASMYFDMGCNGGRYQNDEKDDCWGNCWHLGGHTGWSCCCCSTIPGNRFTTKKREWFEEKLVTKPIPESNVHMGDSNEFLIRLPSSVKLAAKKAASTLWFTNLQVCTELIVTYLSLSLADCENCFFRIREGVKKNNRFFLGLCPKLWVGGGQKS